MWRSLWQTPAAFTLIRTCVPEGCGVGSSISASGALNSATLKLFIVSLPSFLIAFAIFLGKHCHVSTAETNQAASMQRGQRWAASDHLALRGVDRDDLRCSVSEHFTCGVVTHRGRKNRAQEGVRSCLSNYPRRFLVAS